MSSLFLTVFKMSLTASYVACAVIIVRLLLKKAPKIFSYTLWAVVLFRLLCPFSFESPLSLVPDNTDTKHHEIVNTDNPVITTGISMINNTVNQSAQSSLPPVNSAANINPWGKAFEFGSLIWILGIVLLLLYSMISYFRLKHRLSTAVLVRDNIFETDRIQTPFVLGLIKPKIYLPTNLSGSELDYIIKHEQIHIKRYDYIIKFVSFGASVLHWFNPVIWLSYFLMTKDMEMSCDESVMKHSSEDIRTRYSDSLLSLSAKQNGLLSPLSFGESNVKSRIKNILNYKKPTFWVTILAIATVVTVLVSFMANPVNTHTYKNETLGFSLEFPKDWKDRYIIKEADHNISIFCKKINEKYHESGLLFSIERQIGELITKEDIGQAPVNQEIILQGNGYTYLTRIPSDVQYPLNDKELSNEYKVLSEKISDISRSISPIGKRKPEAANKGFKVEGTSFFTVEIPKEWRLKALDDCSLCWNIYAGNSVVGSIALISYYSDVKTLNDNILQEYLLNDQILRKVRITLESKVASQEIMKKIKNSFKFKNDSPFNIVDFESTAEEYLARGGKRIFGQIDSFKMENGNPVAVQVKILKFIPDGPKDNNPNGFHIENLNKTETYSLNSGVHIAPLIAPNYNTYGTYEMPLLDKEFIKNYSNYKDFYYDFITSKDGELQIVLGHYIP
ncbi:MAG: M56 family metallopeptidase [Bacillota bacterium]|jgi:beta-lactamase regulating signal transducer with metallopeptidase domain